VVAVSSPKPIHIKDFDCRMWVHPNAATSGAHFTAIYLTNGTYLTGSPGGASEGNKIGNLRYVHVDIGPFNISYEDRHIYNYSPNATEGMYYTDPGNRTLPSGTWYFIFAGGYFDLPQEETSVNTTVWLNFSQECGPVNVSTHEGGRIYALWYGEFDADVVVSSFGRFEMLLGGNISFHVNNTFVYGFFSYPAAQGFWRVKWIKPGGVTETLNMVIIREYHFPDVYARGECERGLGGSGDYRLMTSSLDYTPLVKRSTRHMYAYPLYFIGLDVKLPQK